MATDRYGIAWIVNVRLRSDPPARAVALSLHKQCRLATARNSGELTNRKGEPLWVGSRGGGMQFTMRKTSRDRFWTGFDATLYDTSGGFAETAMFAEHSLRMHIGTPITASCRCDGAVHHRLEVPGDIDVVPAGFSGSWEADGPTTVLIVNVSLSLTRAAAEGIGLNPDRVSIQPQLQLKDSQLQYVGWAIKAELEADEPVGRIYADSLGLALTAHLLRRYALSVPKRMSGGLPERRLQRVTDYIQDHLTENLKLAQLAAVAGMSASHFKVLFRQSVGVPVHQYVVQRRVDHAIALLRRDTLPFSEVAAQSGFAHQSHMAQCVRRATGMPPSVLKREVP